MKREHTFAGVTRPVEVFVIVPLAILILAAILFDLLGA